MHFLLYNSRNLPYFIRFSMTPLLPPMWPSYISGHCLISPTDLSLGVLPLSVEHVDGEGAAESLHLQPRLERLDQQDQPLAVLDGEAGVVEVVDDLLPVERRLQLVHHLDEQLHVPRLGFRSLQLRSTVI